MCGLLALGAVIFVIAVIYPPVVIGLGCLVLLVGIAYALLAPTRRGQD